MKHRIRITLALAVAAVLAFAAPAVLADDHRTSVKVMTWNLFYGFDDGPVVTAAMSGDPAQIIPAAVEAWRQVHATDFHKRVRDIALRIRLEQPDLIGVQEAVRYVRTDANGTIVETIDHLEILLAALRQTGLEYTIASRVDGTVVPLPLDGTGAAVTLYDHNAVLVRTHNPDVRISNPQHGTFQYNLGPPDFPLALNQGWASVDVAASGHRFRFVTTHLEDASADPANLTPLQMAQATELVNIHLASGLPVVFSGDFNSDGFRKWPTYKLLTGDFGLTDAWTTARRGPGLTWGQSPDLLNPCPRLTQRLDLVLFSGAFRVASAEVVGATILDRIPAGMWPSDHAGVVVTLVP